MTATRLDVDHRALMSYLGAWALSACSPEEAAAVESHLPECARCAEEAHRLRDAVGLLHHEEPLDLDPGLRARVLESCLDRRPPKIPVPEWAAAYDTETARLDALLQDIQDAEWHAPVRLRWFEGEKQVGRRTTVAGVIGHLMTVDGLVAVALGLEDPLGARTPAHLVAPDARTEALWNASPLPQTRSVRRPWREQSHRLVSALSLESDRSAALDVAYGGYALPLRDSLLDRAFECWVHAEDIAGAVDYPYDPPKPRHLNGMIDLAARMLPGVIGQRRQAGLGRGVPEPGGVLHLEIEGAGGGDWYIGLDGAAGEAATGPGRAVAHVALDGVEFCRLAAGHVQPRRRRPGRTGTWTRSTRCSSRRPRSAGCEARPGGPGAPVTPQAKTTVRWPLSRMRCSACHFTARASAWHSTSRPTATSCSG